MKNLAKLFGIIAFVALIGFSMIACDNGTTGGGLNGTWREPSGDRIVFSNGSFTMIDNNVEAYKGTYRTSGNNITLTLTQAKGSRIGPASAGISQNSWYNESQLRQAMINYYISQGATQTQAATTADNWLATSSNPFRNPLTYTYQLDGNTLILDGETYYRQ